MRTYREALRQLSVWEALKMRVCAGFIWCEAYIAPRRSMARCIRLVRGIRR